MCPSVITSSFYLRLWPFLTRRLKSFQWIVLCYLHYISNDEINIFMNNARVLHKTKGLFIEIICKSEGYVKCRLKLIVSHVHRTENLWKVHDLCYYKSFNITLTFLLCKMQTLFTRFCFSQFCQILMRGLAWGRLAPAWTGDQTTCWVRPRARGGSGDLAPGDVTSAEWRSAGRGSGLCRCQQSCSGADLMDSLAVACSVSA